MASPLTKEQAVIISAYTGILCSRFEDMHEYVETKMGRPVWTHEMGNRETWAEIKEACREDFLSILPMEVNQ